MRWLYRVLPGPKAARIAIMTVLALIVLTVVIWSYAILGDLIDTGGRVGG